MNTPADCPHLLEYLPFLISLLHLEELNMIPVLDCSVTEVPTFFTTLIFFSRFDKVDFVASFVKIGDFSS